LPFILLPGTEHVLNIWWLKEKPQDRIMLFREWFYVVKASFLTNTREKRQHLGIQKNPRKNPWETMQSDKREKEEMNSQSPKV